MNAAITTLNTQQIYRPIHCYLYPKQTFYYTKETHPLKKG